MVEDVSKFSLNQKQFEKEPFFHSKYGLYWWKFYSVIVASTVVDSDLQIAVWMILKQSFYSDRPHSLASFGNFLET